MAIETLFGRKVIVSPHIQPIPVLKTAHDFRWCTDAYRAKHDAWLLERFGTYDPTYVLADGTICASPATMAKLRQELRYSAPK